LPTFFKNKKRLENKKTLKHKKRDQNKKKRFFTSMALSGGSGPSREKGQCWGFPAYSNAL